MNTNTETETARRRLIADLGRAVQWRRQMTHAHSGDPRNQRSLATLEAMVEHVAGLSPRDERLVTVAQAIDGWGPETRFLPHTVSVFGFHREHPDPGRALDLAIANASR